MTKNIGQKSQKKFSFCKLEWKRVKYMLVVLACLSLGNVHAGGVVTNTNDSGSGSLRYACTGGGTVVFSPSLVSGGNVTITLLSEIAITDPITINGLTSGPDTVFISGSNSNRIFNINYSSSPGSTTTSYLNDLVFINGNASFDYGGAIRCVEGNLEVNDCIFMNNAARWGGAIGFWEYNGSWSYQLTINNSSFFENTATNYGGAIYCADKTSGSNTARVTVNNSTISRNTASTGGSAIYCSSSTSSTSVGGNSVSSRIHVNQSTIYDNYGSRAIQAYAAYSNSSANSARSYIYIYNSTVYDNSGYGIYIYGESGSYIYLRSSIIAQNSIYHNNGATNDIISSGYNIFSLSSITGSSGSDQMGVSNAALKLGPLAFNGGNTQTLTPLEGSVAIDQGHPSYTVDAQNGPILGVRDVGACEQTASFSTDVVTSCGPHTWIDGNTYTTSNNTATDTLVNSLGNDSIVTLDLTVYPVYNESVSASICSGDSYTLGTQTLTTSGVYNETFTSVNGCDSTVQLTLTMNSTSSSTDVISACSSHTWIDGITYTSSTNTPTWTLTNAAGCDSIVTLNLTIGDIVGPVPDLATLPDVTDQCSVSSLSTPTATDNCSPSITVTHNASLPITAQGTTVVTWTYDDGNGNTSTQTQNVVITDNTSPVADVGSLSDVTSECQVTMLTAPTATDNCAGSITATHDASLPITSQGTTIVTWTYNDGNGNTSTQMQNVVIDDVTAPVANNASLSDVTAECQVTSLSAPTATDNCAGTVTGTHNASLPITGQGTTMITWTYDDGNGNISTQTQNVVITDVTPPVANVGTLPTLNDPCSITTLVAPTATDNCAGSITGTHNATLPITAQGTTVVTWTYDDGYGNTSTQTQNVVIDDITAPVADLATITDVTAECQITSLVAPTATDNCSGTIQGVPNVSFPITTQGTFTITWTYNDGNGNTSTQPQNVTINDVTAPIPDNAILATISDECSVDAISAPAPTATDNCAGTITATPDVSFPITSSTTIIWTYDDGNGNTTTQTQSVTITGDVTAPVADITMLSDLNEQCEITSLTPPTATDNCAGSITGTHNASFPITASTVITWTYDDGNGNTSAQTQNVVIDDVTAPVADIANLSDLTAECEITSLSAPTATDNCVGSVTATHNATLPITSSTTITWTYDDGNGNTSTQTQNAVINDVTAPVADVANLSDLTGECEITSLTAPTATDNCMGAITGTHNETLPIASSTTIIWTYDDGNGNTSTQTQNVVITPIDNGVTQVNYFTLSADANGYTYQWVDCNNGNAPMSGETNQVFEASANGSYAVIIDNGDCSVTSFCFDITTVGIEEQVLNELNIYPNPTKRNLTIDMGRVYEKVILKLLTVDGRLLQESENTNQQLIDVMIEGKSGAYILEIQAEGHLRRMTVIKE